MSRFYGSSYLPVGRFQTSYLYSSCQDQWFLYSLRPFSLGLSFQGCLIRVLSGPVDRLFVCWGSRLDASGCCWLVYSEFSVFLCFLWRFFCFLPMVFSTFLVCPDVAISLLALCFRLAIFFSPLTFGCFSWSCPFPLCCLRPIGLFAMLSPSL